MTEDIFENLINYPLPTFALVYKKIAGFLSLRHFYAFNSFLGSFFVLLLLLFSVMRKRRPKERGFFRYLGDGYTLPFNCTHHYLFQTKIEGCKRSKAQNC